MISATSQKILEKFPIRKPILLYGENLYEMEAALDLIRRRAREEGIETVLSFQGDEMSWSQLAGEVSTGGLFGDRLVIVRHAEAIREDRPGAQEAVLKNCPDDTHLVFLAAKDLDQRKKTTRNFENYCQRIACALPAQARLPEWIAAFAQSKGYSIPVNLAELIATFLENDTLRIAMELEKLFTYVGDRRKIDEGDLAACLAFSREEVPWAVADHLLAGDMQAALLSVKRLRDAGTHPAVVLVLVARQMKKLYEISCLRAKRLAPPAIIRRLGLNPYYGQKDVDMARRYPKERFGAAVTEIVRAEALMKSSQVDDRLLLETMLFRIHRALNAAPGGATRAAGR